MVGFSDRNKFYYPLILFMIIAAVGDVHSPQYYEEFIRAVDTMKAKPDLFLISGDMVNRGRIEEFDKVYNVLFGKINCPIVAVFGNNEYKEIREKIKEKYKEIKFLDDESTVIQIGKRFVGIIGTTGSLDTPTPWQRKNIPDIEKTYRERVSFVEKHLQRLVTNFKIVLMHYSPTYKTLEGENPMFHSSFGSRVYERVLFQRKPELVIHGHSHKGLKQAWVDSVPVFNVSLPVNREIVIIDTEKDLKPGIAKFV